MITIDGNVHTIDSCNGKDLNSLLRAHGIASNPYLPMMQGTKPNRFGHNQNSKDSSEKVEKDDLDTNTICNE